MEKTNTPRRNLMIELGCEDSVFFENPNYDSAIIGYDANNNRIIYDYEKMVEHLMDLDGMDYEDAIEFIDYNTIRSIPYAGSNAPIVLHNIDVYPPYDDDEIPYEFDSKRQLDKCIEWTREWFKNNAPNHKAVLGMSGGKDSTIAAAILCKALGAENVIGVAMPCGDQGLNDADKICEYLGIKFVKINIEDAVNSVTKSTIINLGDFTKQAETNIPPRIRMTTLYAVAQSCDGIVINTCNLSESYIGYETLYGDLAGSMSPIKNLTATEIISLGDELELPHEWVHKTPDDGLPNSSPDEIKFGFTYKALDSWIRKNEVPDEFEVILKIVEKHDKSQFKRDIINIPAYDPGLKVY